MFPKPWDVGVNQGDKWRPLDERAVTELQLSSKAQLTDLVDDMVFYTPGILHARFQLIIDFHAAYQEELSLQCPQVSLRFEHPVFRGLQVGYDPEWNYVLFGMHKQHWEPFRQWLGTAAITNTGELGIGRIRFQDVEVRDPLNKDLTLSLHDIPRVPVVVLCVETDKGSGYMVPHALGPPSYKWNPRAKWSDTQQFAHAILREKSDPYKESEK